MPGATPYAAGELRRGDAIGHDAMRPGPRAAAGGASPLAQLALTALLALGGCAAPPLMPYSADTPPLVLLPAAQAGAGDGGAVASLRPAVRQAWLAANPLPKDVRYYSLVTFPQPERISTILEGSYDKLARVDARNDSQVIFYNQIIPGSTLLGFVNADHWALAVPIARKERLATAFADQNDYPREAMAEAILRMVEEDLAAGSQ